MSIVTILSILVSSMIVYAAPLIFTSIGGAYSEHAGVVNVGLEGIMVMGAFSGIIFNLTFEPELGSLTPWLSLIVAAGIGVLFSLIHAVATIHFRADHIVSGTVLNLMAPPLAVFLVKAMYNKGQTDNIKVAFGKTSIPVLSKIPVIGDIFFNNASIIGLGCDSLFILCLVYHVQDEVWIASSFSWGTPTSSRYIGNQCL